MRSLQCSEFAAATFASKRWIGLQGPGFWAQRVRRGNTWGRKQDTTEEAILSYILGEKLQSTTQPSACFVFRGWRYKHQHKAALNPNRQTILMECLRRTICQGSRASPLPSPARWKAPEIHCRFGLSLVLRDCLPIRA
jgi:hypothetical protein